jgi:hypothetical protein
MWTRTTLILAGAGAVALAAGPASAAKGHHGLVTLKATGKVDQAKVVDNAPAGDSPGDVLVFTEKLYNARGKQIGSDAATCVRLFDASSLCTGVYKLRGGQVHVQLVQPGPTGTYEQAVVGGTGRFAGARGTVTVDQNPSTGDRFTFRIRMKG